MFSDKVFLLDFKLKKLVVINFQTTPRYLTHQSFCSEVRTLYICICRCISQVKMSLKFVLICYHLRIYWVGSIQHVESSLSAKFQLDLLSNSGIIANNIAKCMFSFSLN